MGKYGKGILAVLFGVGIIAALGKVFFWGESVTNYGSYAPWGLWVALYIFLVGAAAGAAWTGIYAAHQNGGQPNRLTTLSFIVAGLSLGFGLSFIGMDLGKPLKGIFIFLSPSFSSKLTIASWTYMLFFASLAGYFFGLYKGSGLKQICMYLAGVFAIGFVSAEGMFFGSMVARELWNSWSTIAAFFTSSITAGSALVYLAGLLFKTEVIAEEGTNIKKLLIAGMGSHIAIEAVHLTGSFKGATAAAAMGMLSSWPYWLLFIILGVLVPLFMLFNKNMNRMSPITPALILLGLAAYKYSFIRYGFTVEPLPGIAEAFHHMRLSTAYFPSVVEWLIGIGFAAGLLLAIAIALSEIPRLLKIDK